MSGAERKLVTAIRDSAEIYLAATNHAERYVYGRAFVNAVIDFQTYALRQEAAAKKEPSA